MRRIFFKIWCLSAIHQIDLQKKMRRLIMILTATFLPAVCMAQHTSMFGLEVSRMVSLKGLGLSFRHDFCRHWTAGGGFDFAMMPDSGNLNEKETHDQTFVNEKYIISKAEEQNIRDGNNIWLSFQYYPSGAFSGGFISFGVRIDDRESDLTLGAGYFFTLWKRIKCEVAYEFDVKDTVTEERLKGTGLKTTIYINISKR